MAASFKWALSLLALLIVYLEVVEAWPRKPTKEEQDMAFCDAPGALMPGEKPASKPDGGFKVPKSSEPTKPKSTHPKKPTQPKKPSQPRKPAQPRKPSQPRKPAQPRKSNPVKKGSPAKKGSPHKNNAVHHSGNAAHHSLEHQTAHHSPSRHVAHSGSAHNHKH